MMTNMHRGQVVIVGISFLTLLSGCANPSAVPRQPGFQPPNRTISTSGTATLHVKPDEVTLRFAVETRDPDLAKAKAANDAASRAALDTLKSLHVEDRDI